MPDHQHGGKNAIQQGKPKLVLLIIARGARGPVNVSVDSLSLHFKPSCDAYRAPETASLPALCGSLAESKPSPSVGNRRFRLCFPNRTAARSHSRRRLPMHKKTIGPFSLSRRLALAYYCASPADTYSSVNVALFQVHVLSPCLLDPLRCAPARPVPFLRVFPKSSDRYCAARAK